MVSVWVADVSHKVAVCEPGVLVTIVTLVKLSVPSEVPALNVPAFDPVRLSAVPAGFAEIVSVFESEAVPVKVMLLLLVFAVETATVVKAAPAKVV